MKNAILGTCIAAGLFLAPIASLAADTPAPTKAEVKAEKSEHPRIAKAIKDLDDAIAYMEKAPHDFGGHKAAAISACREAIAQLRLALEYRAVKDNK
jgi:hypothetical protein